MDDLEYIKKFSKINITKACKVVKLIEGIYLIIKQQKKILKK